MDHTYSFPWKNNMIDKVKTYIIRNGIPQEGKIVVGLSGGEDSVALLHILKRLGYDCIAAHCNFNLRGKESERDEIFSENYSNSLGVKFLKTTFDTSGYAKKKKISIEMAARELRYEWFEKVRTEENACAIAVAHHRNDDIETFLLNLFRGTGIRGLCGMSPFSRNIIRPLLGVSKAEIFDYLKENGLEFVTDSTNDETDFKRNKIRKVVLPMLETFNPSIESSLARTMANMKESYKIYLDAINKYQNYVFHKNEINIEKLLKTPSPEALLYEIVSKYGFNKDDVEEMLHALNTQAGAIFLSNEFKIVRERTSFSLRPLKKEELQAAAFYIGKNDESIHIPIEMIITKSEIKEDFEMTKDNKTAYFDERKLKYPLLLRKWKRGDKFRPFGMKGFKKLSDYFNDKKFNTAEKEKQWLLCSEGEIIWIVGERTDDRYKIDKGTKEVAVFKLFSK